MNGVYGDQNKYVCDACISDNHIVVVDNLICINFSIFPFIQMNYGAFLSSPLFFYLIPGRRKPSVLYFMCSGTFMNSYNLNKKYHGSFS
jgi:hypothetical protein